MQEIQAQEPAPELDEEAERIFDALEPTPPKSRYYFVNVVAVAWEEVSMIDVIGEAIAGFLVPIAANKFNLSERSELPELFFLSVGAAIFVPLCVFVVRLIFGAPYDLYKRQKRVINYQKEQIEGFEEERNKANEIRPFGVEMTSGRVCHIKISNPNPTSYQLHFKLLNIEPPLCVRPEYSTEIICLSAGYFTVMDSPGDFVDPKETVTIELFRLGKHLAQDDKYILFFKGVWNRNNTHNFPADGEHVFTFSIASDYIETARHVYRLKFDSVGGVFSAEKIR